MKNNESRLEVGVIDHNGSHSTVTFPNPPNISFHIANVNDVPANVQAGVFRFAPTDQFATFIPVSKLAVLPDRVVCV